MRGGEGGFLRYSRTRLTHSPLLGNEQIAAESRSLLLVLLISERPRAPTTNREQEREADLRSDLLLLLLTAENQVCSLETEI